MNKCFYNLTLGLMALVVALTAVGRPGKGPPQYPADVAPGEPWQDAPNNFVFGNHIDTHVQLRLEEEAGVPVSLRGSFYIVTTDNDGVTSLGTDPVSGLPIARHPRGAMHNEVCGDSSTLVTCLVGWHLDGVPGNAKFLYHSGINGGDHPVWMVNRAEEYDPLSPSPSAPGMVIPQPGYYSHYHWITMGSTVTDPGLTLDPRASSVSPACDKADAGQLQNNAPTAVNQVCQGWFLQLTAVREFAFMHGGELIPVHLGEDLRTHLNMVTNYSAETGPTGGPTVDITSTR